MISFLNKDTDSSSYEKIKDTPRPGHADLTGKLKFNGYNDYRGGGHFIPVQHIGADRGERQPRGLNRWGPALVLR